MIVKMMVVMVILMVRCLPRIMDVASLRQSSFPMFDACDTVWVSDTV